MVNLICIQLSLGVNIFLEINKHLSNLMNNYPIYNTYIEETHHKEKLDSPSGTAITTAEIIIANDKYNNWDNSNSKDANIILLQKENQMFLEFMKLYMKIP